MVLFLFFLLIFHLIVIEVDDSIHWGLSERGLVGLMPKSFEGKNGEGGESRKETWLGRRQSHLEEVGQYTHPS